LSFSLLGVLLALGTLSLSGFASMIFGASIFLLAKLFFAFKSKLQANFLKIKKILVPLAVCFPFLVSVLWSSGFIDNAYRLARINQKLDDRLDKSSQILGACDDLGCKMFGSGPGAHSIALGSIPGEQSVLAFDSLYGRLLYEWGLVGTILFAVVLVFLLHRGNGLRFSFPSSSFLGLLAFASAFGVGSEFIFVSPSGALFATFLSLTLVSQCPKKVSTALMNTA
jgi:hypothetical protein